MNIKLDAVNELLEAIGEDPVQSLESGLADAEGAAATLDRVSRDTQEIGWHCNTDRNILLAPDYSGYIRVAPTVLRIDAVGRSRLLDVVTRVDPNDNQSKLFNRVTQSFSFSDPVQVDITWNLAFETLTPALRRYITSHAAIRFQKQTLGSVVVDRFLKEERDNAWAALLDSESENEDLNILRDNPHCRSIAYRNNEKMGS